ncbi:MAG: YlxM family DNA-binding protein [Limnochordales bacterium]
MLVRKVSTSKKVRMNLLYDFYGQLLTKKQRTFFDLYYQADLSLGEIAAQHDVTRQAVYDILKRSERALEEFEAKLNLVDKYLRGQKVIRQVTKDLQELADDIASMVGADRAEDVAGRIRRIGDLVQSLADGEHGA